MKLFWNKAVSFFMRGLFGVLLLASSVTQAQTTEQEVSAQLTQYFELLTSAGSPTDPAIFKQANQHWLKGVQGKHVAVARFFSLHAPTGWTFSNAQSAGDYAAIEAHFDSLNFDRLWRTRFELAKVDSEWKVTEFENLTLRPFDDDGAGPGDLVMAYIAAVQAVADSDDERVRRFLPAGRGFLARPADCGLTVLPVVEAAIPDRARY